MDNIKNLSDLGYREIELLIELLKVYNESVLPDKFSNKNVTWEYNPCSGYIFLTNSDNQVLLLNEDYDLEIQYLCPYCGFEGFKDELLYNGNDCCGEYLEELGVL